MRQPAFEHKPDVGLRDDLGAQSSPIIRVGQSSLSLPSTHWHNNLACLYYIM